MTCLAPYHQQTWVIAVSGGPDSMALLDMARRSGIDCRAVHVNYHLRESADRDALIVKTYCQQYDIPLIRYEASPPVGNVQDYARKVRYTHFAQVVKQSGAEGVLVAHHLGDDLETYMIQKLRKSQVTHYGLASSTVLYDVRVDRPLLGMTKEALIAHCMAHQVPFGLDETNESPAYLRNRLRQEIAQLGLDHPSMKALLEEKARLNAQLEQFIADHHSELEGQSMMIRHYEAMDHALLFLDRWIRRHVPPMPISEDHLLEIDRQIREARSFRHKLGTWRLVKQYGRMCLLPPPPTYRYTIDHPHDLDTPYFRLRVSAEPQHGFDVIDDDFPLVIRNAHPNERYLQDGTSKNLARWWISHKILQGERDRWPVVENRHGEVIHLKRIKLTRSLNPHKSHLYMIE
jgi:tRNA(Ile)-lysidine synthase